MSNSLQSQKLETLLNAMWKDYVAINPAAGRIFELFAKRGEDVVNDHIALRTFQHPRLGLKHMAAVFEQVGYQAKGEYVFKEKKLFARHWEHPDPRQPKIFISELELKHFPNRIQDLLIGLIEQVPAEVLSREDFVNCGRPWTLDHQTYLELAAVSEYASWVAAYGFRANHFTVSFNHLKTFKDLEELNSFIKANGYQLNASGGEIKGTPAECLEQSSTLAETVPVEFTDGRFEVPSVYYEFARRYPMESGAIYQGFIAKSADKIFESTDRRR